MSCDLLKDTPDKTLDLPAQLAAAPQERGRFRAWAVLLIMAAVFAFGLRDIVLGRAVFHYADDWDRYFLPYYMAVADFARSGRLLLWDPWNNMGIPVFAEPQVGVFSPLVLGFGLLTGGTVWGSTLYSLTMWFLGGVGMVLLGRRCDVPWWGCLVGALGYLGCGAFLGHQMHTSHVVSCAFIPLVLWRLQAGLAQRHWLPMAQSGALLGLSSLAGYPALTLWTLVLMGIWAACWHATGVGLDGERPAATTLRSLCRRWIWLAVALGLCVGISALVVLPSHLGLAYEGQGVTSRSGTMSVSAGLATNALCTWAVAGITSPHTAALLRENSVAPYPGDLPMFVSVYCGIAILVLASFEMLCHWRSLWHWALLGFGVISFLAALGTATPVRMWLYENFTPTQFNRVTTSFRDYLFVSLCVLAMLGARTLERTAACDWAWRALRLRAAVRIWTVIAVVLYGWVLSFCYKRENALALGIAHVALWLVAAAVVSWLARSDGRRRRVLSFALAAVAVVDLGLTLEVGHGDFYSHPEPEAWALMAKMSQLRQAAPEADHVPVYREASYPMSNEGVAGRLPAIGGYTPLRNPYITYRHARDFWRVPMTVERYRYASGEQRFWFSPEGVWSDPESPVHAELVRRQTAEVPEVPLLLHSRASMLGADTVATRDAVAAVGAAPAMVRADVHAEQYTPTHLVLRGRMSEPGWLLVTDRWSRSWQATVNGQQTEVLGANLIFRAVKVPAGDVTIDFQYDTRWIWALALVSWITLGAVLLLTIWRIRIWSAAIRIANRSPGKP